MKHTFTYVICALSLCSSLAQAAPAKPKYGPQATRLHDSHEFISKTAAKDYWAMSPYYLPQQDGSACMLASFTMTLNAMRAGDKLTAADTLVSQPALLKVFAADDKSPAKRFYLNKGKSITLTEMGDLFKKAATEFLHHSVSVDVLHADKIDQAFLQKVEKVLIENEGSAKNFVVANFLQSEYTGDPEGAVGHVAPVAAYDAKQKRVLIFDPDREYYEPYWVSLETFVKGLATLDQDAGKNRGILWIHE